MKQMTLGTIDKKLEIKEKEIGVEIEKFKKEKVEVILAQVKKGIKNENLDVTSDSVMKILGSLRKDEELE